MTYGEVEICNLMFSQSSNDLITIKTFVVTTNYPFSTYFGGLFYCMFFSEKKADVGLAYIIIHGTKNKTTTVMWDPQVERALRLPSVL